jgi:hypothetical protein
VTRQTAGSYNDKILFSKYHAAQDDTHNRIDGELRLSCSNPVGRYYAEDLYKH